VSVPLGPGNMQSTSTVGNLRFVHLRHHPRNPCLPARCERLVRAASATGQMRGRSPTDEAGRE
jgi:hypothetical protein